MFSALQTLAVQTGEGKTVPDCRQSAMVPTAKID
jgi:hypothetical protein